MKVSTRALACRAGGLLALAASIVLFPAGGPVAAQTLPRPALRTVRAADYNAFSFVPRTDAAMKTAVAPASTFRVDFSDNFPEKAKIAFQYAANIWASHLQSSVTVVIEAHWEALDEGVLGSAGPYLTGNFNGAPVRNTWYPFALADAISGTNLHGDSPDIFAQFSSAFDNWYFELDGNTPPNTYDFVTVVLHELGHGLGFTGSFDYDNGDDTDYDECPNVGTGYGCWGIPANESGTLVYPYIFDRFTEDGQERALLNTAVYGNPSLELGVALTSRAVFFDGDAVRLINKDIPVDLFAPENFEAGSSYAHLDEQSFRPNTPQGVNALMTPYLAAAEAIHSPGPLACAIFQDIGWPLAANCLTLISTGIESYQEPVVAGTDVTLSWQLAATLNLDRIVIERLRRYTSTTYDSVGVVTGTAAKEMTQQIKLENQPAGTYYYRLRLVYAAGARTEYSPSREVVIKLDGDYELSAFSPNPTRNRAQAVVMVGKSQRVYAELYDVVGRRLSYVFNRNLVADRQDSISFSMAGMPSGMYFVHVVGDDFTATRRITFVR